MTNTVAPVTPLIRSSVDPINLPSGSTAPTHAHNGILGTFRLIDGWRDGADKLDTIRSWANDLRKDKAKWLTLWPAADAVHAERVFTRFIAVFG